MKVMFREKVKPSQIEIKRKSTQHIEIKHGALGKFCLHHLPSQASVIYSLVYIICLTPHPSSAIPAFRTASITSHTSVTCPTLSASPDQSWLPPSPTQSFLIYLDLLPPPFQPWDIFVSSSSFSFQCPEILATSSNLSSSKRGRALTAVSCALTHQEAELFSKGGFLFPYSLSLFVLTLPPSHFLRSICGVPCVLVTLLPLALLFHSVFSERWERCSPGQRKILGISGTSRKLRHHSWKKAISSSSISQISHD